MRSRGIGPLSQPWKGCILPLNYERAAAGLDPPLGSENIFGGIERGVLIRCLE